MEKTQVKKIENMGLIACLLPVLTLIPTIFKIHLAPGVQSVWGIANVIFVIAGFVLTITALRMKKTRNAVNIIASCICLLWVLILLGAIVVVVVSNM
ncbi:MAG: hypothetical protein J6Y02_17040 [Pseudobutyrivibrio sp.]|nr:hypothetical protein [Pseudobutyrivibrio sp.]